MSRGDKERGRIEPPESQDEYAIRQPPPPPLASPQPAPGGAGVSPARQHPGPDARAAPGGVPSPGQRRPRVYERDIPAERPDEPPRLWFASGVFTFPFRLRSLAVWLMMSMGLTLTTVYMVVTLWMIGYGLLLVEFLVATCWIVGLAVSFASACCLSVIESTASGYDQVEEWYAGDWREWLWSMLYIVGMLVPAGAAGAAVKWLAGSWTAAGAATLVLYPVVLVSVLENGSPLALVSPTVLKTLKAAWGAWLIFYAESGVLVGAFVLLAVRQFPAHRWALAFASGPLLAALALVYFRLLGRLIWYAGTRTMEDVQD
jgi:hypothetical protein